ncbi:hypothetical protein M9H77_08738 [Catharanthus roseus]|uniref:Uncharacterized protein n=1 Tax=Catharanthus roseus TaxID=4058 RepID=A0ACC0BZ27_CATRO|nr:hypothetical protein M9H77_08738 [Catharanthus roseus]
MFRLNMKPVIQLECGHTGWLCDSISSRSCIIGVQLGYYLKKELKNKERSKPQRNMTLLLLGIEVVLRFKGVKELKGFKIKQLVPRESLEELKRFTVQYAKEVVTIEEAKDVTKLPLNDLLGYLRAYGMNLDVESNDKGIALKVEHNHLIPQPIMKKML